MSAVRVDGLPVYTPRPGRVTLSTSVDDPTRRVTIAGEPGRRIVDIFDATELPILHVRRTQSDKDGKMAVGGMLPNKFYDLIARDPVRRDALTPRVSTSA